jgi:hypothetical protein
VINFAAHSPGPAWTPAVSREKIDQILSVAVDFRTASNTLPAHAEVSLQAVIRNFDPARQTAILQIKLRDLEVAQFHVAPPLAALTAEYRDALADYLGERRETVPAPRFNKQPLASPQRASALDTLTKLDALDARRRVIESDIKPDVWRP